MELNKQKSRRIKIEEAKEALKNNAELVKQEFGIIVPKNIMNMDYLSLHAFVRNALETITQKGSASQEINNVVGKLEACMKAFRYYRFDTIKSREPEIL